MTYLRPLFRLVTIATLLTVEVQSASKKKASDYFELCKRSDPDITNCMKKSIQVAKPLLAKGIPELKLPPLDPLFLPSVDLQEGEGNFRFRLALINLTMEGLQNFNVMNLSIESDKSIWVLDMLTPTMRMSGKYEMDGRLLSLPIQGNGEATLNFEGVRTECTALFKNVTRNGQVFATVDKVYWKIDADKGQSHFTNLFNGDPTLGDTTNKFLNENWRDAFESYKHLPQEALGAIFKDFFERFYSHFPLEELFPE